MKILIVNGVNLNMTGKREPIYGEQSLDEINASVSALAESLGAQTEFYQSNLEGEIVDRLQKLDYDALVINPGAYSHYSIAVADALAYVKKPKIEVHLTNIFAREEFRRESVTARNCDGVISGFGSDGYCLAVEYLVWKQAEN